MKPTGRADKPEQNPSTEIGGALTESGLDLETKIFSASGRGRTFFLTSLFIELIDKIVREIVTLVGAKTHRQQRSGKTTIGLEESKLNTTNGRPGPVQGGGHFVQPPLDGRGPGFVTFPDSKDDPQVLLPKAEVGGLFVKLQSSHVGERKPKM